MALRTLVTGSDMCTGSDGAGPSNAVGALVNQLLGTASKTQEQLRDLPAQHAAIVPPHMAMPPTADAAAAAAAGVALPGMAAPSSSMAHLEAFFPGAPASSSAAAQRTADMVAEFEQAQRAGLLPVMPPGHMPLVPPGPPPMTAPPMLGEALKAFLRPGAAIPPGMMAGMPPGMQLSLPDAVRLRDRATILARQLNASPGGPGAAAADQQVAALLASLSIDPASLPAELPHQAAPAEWAAVWEGQAARGRPPEPLVGADMAAAQAAAAAGNASNWDAIFHSRPGSHRPMPQAMARPQSTGWADEFAVQQQQAQPGTWAGEFRQQQGGWAEEFQEQQQGGAANAWAEGFAQEQEALSTDRHGSSAASTDARATSARLVAALTADGDPKMQNSKFLQFLSKMSKGELLFEDNKVVERPAGEAWANDFGAAASTAAGPSAWASEFQQQQQPQQQPVPPRDWADEFANGVANINLNTDELTEEQLEAAWAAIGGAGAASNWAQEFADNDHETADWDNIFARNAEAAAAAGLASALGDGEYVFAETNPFLGDAAAFEKGKDLFKRGLLSEAALALEAEVRQHPENAPAWRLLGTVHAENDDDRQAIAALNKALEADPNSLEVLLSLGVSHTNELDAGKALGFLRRWLEAHPTHRDVAAATGPPPDSSQALSHTSRLFEAASKARPEDSELQLALGVLHHLGRHYDAAIAAFQRALELRPGDYSLWNKLGATLANYSHSSEAVAAYRKALDLKPNYMRAWTNMGISYANLGDYMASAAYYVRALSLNPSASHVWGYLRTSLACAGQIELLTSVDKQDIEALQKAIPL